MASRADQRRERFAQICLALPGVERRGGQHDRFSVRGRTVAYYLDDHHGDGMTAVTCKAPPGMRDVMVASDPERPRPLTFVDERQRYFVPSYFGPKGWISLRIDLPSIDWDEVGELVTDSYRLVAPSTLVARLGE